MTDFPRLIEHAFPLKQASLDSVHEKNVRHGHISTLHIWPARRPLAACRAALIATLLPDPSADPKPAGMSDEEWHAECAERRRGLCEKIGGKVRQVTKRQKGVDVVVEETEGGILHWKRETENAEVLNGFRQEIRKAYGGRAPKVLDPFAGGGSIPLEAMRLGCEATAFDINPVAWFILKCTLEYPQRLAGQKRRLPDFILRDRGFMARYLGEVHGMKGRRLFKTMVTLGLEQEEARHPGDRFAAMVAEADDTNRYIPADVAPLLEADLAWHVRAWGQWVLERARRDLAQFYPVYAGFEPLNPESPVQYERQPMRLVPLKPDGNADIATLNTFDAAYLGNPNNPRWVAKPTVAYLWARTVACKNCRAILPLLKTRWLCKKESKRVLLTMAPRLDKTGIEFGIQTNVPAQGGNGVQRREHDKRLGAGTMSRAGATCPGCGAIMTMADIRLEGRSGRLGQVMTAVVVDGQHGKEYRLPTAHELASAESAKDHLERVFADIPFGLPTEPTPKGGGGASRAFSVDGYGFDQWHKLFTPRQLVALGTFVRATRTTMQSLGANGYPADWVEGTVAYLAAGVDRLADRSSMQCRPDPTPTQSGVINTFSRFALPMLWDFAEGVPVAEGSGSFPHSLEWVTRYLDLTSLSSPKPRVEKSSAVGLSARADILVTDPPYYDAIPYSDLMDFFYVWLRRTLHGLSPEFDAAFSAPLAPKWDDAAADGELIDDASRHGGDAAKSKQAYEDGMARVFQACHAALTPEGRLVVVFAHKHPDAWETLVSAIIRAGFVVDASWPIQTEMGNRMRAMSSAALASSVWLVCRKRPAAARSGWDNQVLAEMRANIAQQLRDFWDAGIRGPDFVWAATGPALEAYSKHPVVKKANAPDQVMTVTEFLEQARRIVVDYVVGRVLSGGDDLRAAESLDGVTAYYLLHRHDFGLDEAPVGACILYAVSCGLSDRELAGTWDILQGGGSVSEDEDDDESADEADTEGADEGAGGKVKLKPWKQRKGRSLGFEAPGGRPVPLIDRIHCLMHLWRAGDVVKVDNYLDENALPRNELFKRVLQSLIELAATASEERSLLESISSHVRGVSGEHTPGLGLENEP